MPIINTALTLKDLPPPPPGKTGWPWTEQSQPLPERMPNGAEWPRVSVVTPSYNQDQFIEETIRSVLLQGYPNLEYIIIDGGSTDNTIEILKKYNRYLAYWVSEPDRGQSHAVNKGFQKATGEWIGWQNSDDYYHPQAIDRAVQESFLFKNIDIIYGTVLMVHTQTGSIEAYPVSPSIEAHEMIPYSPLANQSTFFNKKIFKDGNFMDELLHHALDLEFYLRLAIKGYRFHFVPEITGCVRLHPSSKTSTQDEIFTREYFKVYKLTYNNTDLPSNLREKALTCMLGRCLDNFGKSRLHLFRESTRDLIAVAGFRYLSPEIAIKYLISLMGPQVLNNLRKIKNKNKNKEKY